MKKIICFLLVLTSLCLTGCSWFKRPADIEIIGVGIIQNDNGLLFIEMGSEKYTPNYVYAVNYAAAENFRIDPFEGLIVTTYTYADNPSKVNFIAGRQNKEYIEECLFNEYKYKFILISFSIFCLLFVLGTLIVLKPRKNHSKKIENPTKKG